jgi:hypothetical protein
MDDASAPNAVGIFADGASVSPLIEHVERVAAALAPDAEPVAFLREVIEQTPTAADALRRHGLTEVELTALELLTQAPGECFELYVLRIAHAQGTAGRLARLVKLAELEDRLAKPWTLGDPPYAWARRHIVNARERRDLRPPAERAAPATERSGPCAAGSHTPDLRSCSRTPSTPRLTR